MKPTFLFRSYTSPNNSVHGYLSIWVITFIFSSGGPCAGIHRSTFHLHLDNYCWSNVTLRYSGLCETFGRVTFLSYLWLKFGHEAKTGISKFSTLTMSHPYKSADSVRTWTPLENSKTLTTVRIFGHVFPHMTKMEKDQFAIACMCLLRSFTTHHGRLHSQTILLGRV